MAGPYNRREYANNVGGMNLISGPRKVRDFEWEDAQNIDIDTDGSVKQRNGHTLIGTVVPAKNELVSWWRMEELAGTRFDSAQGRNAVAATGATGNEAGFEGSRAATFDGAASKLEIASGLQFNLSRPGGDFSISFWYKAAAHAAARTIFSRSNGAGTAGYDVTDVGGAIRIRVYRPGPITIEVTAGATIDDGAWHHVVVTHDASAEDVKVYIDGALNAQFTDAPRPDYTDFAATFFIGASQSGTPEFLGALDDISFWSVELTGPNVTTLRNAGVQGGTAIFLDNGVSKAWKMLKEFKPRGAAREIIGVCAGLVVRYESATGRFQPIPWPSNFASYLSGTARHTVEQVNNRLYFNNGVDPNWRYEGNLVLQTRGLTDGGTRVVANLTLQAGGAIEADGSWYQYRLVPVRQVGGGRIIVGRPTTVASATIQVPAGPNQTIRIADWTGATAVDLPGQTHWGLYRIRKAASADPDPLSAYQFIADLPVTTTTYDDATSQANAAATGDNLALYFENRKTPPVKYVKALSINHGDIMLQAGDPNLPDLLYPTSLSQGPDVHLASSEEFVGRDDGDPINGLAFWFGNAIIYKEGRIFVFNQLYDDTEFPFALQQTFSEIGLSSPYSIINLEDLLFWKADEGIYEMRGVDGYGNIRFRKISRRIEPRLAAIAGARKGDVVGVYLRRPGRHHARFAWTPIGAVVNTEIYPYDDDHKTPDPVTNERIGAWPSVWRGVTAEVMAAIEDATTTDLDDIWIGDDQGRVFKGDTGDTDATGANGAAVAISSYLHTKHYDHGMGKTTKRHRELTLEGATSGGGALSVEWVNDLGERAGGATSFTLGKQDVAAAAEWGIADWGVGVWGGGAGQAESTVGRKRIHNATGHHLQLKFGASALGMSWVLHSWQVGAVPIGSHRATRV